MHAELNKWCQQVGYSAESLVDGMLDLDFLRMQAIEHEQNPDTDPAHYKAAAYRYLLAKINWRDHSQFRQFIQIVETDPDRHFYEAAIGELIDSGKVRYDWFVEFPDARFLKQESIQQKLAKIKPV